MNFLVYLGLQRYNHLSVVREHMSYLAAQSQSTFLVEWISHRRVMEHFNANTGQGCDVQRAHPFYHWGALAALVSELHEEEVDDLGKAEQLNEVAYAR